MGGQSSGTAGLWGGGPQALLSAVLPAEATKRGSHLGCFMFLKNGSPRRWVAPGLGQMTPLVCENGSRQAQ